MITRSLIIYAPANFLLRTEIVTFSPRLQDPIFVSLLVTYGQILLRPNLS